MGVSIGIIAIKGGVGKTTISASLASELARTHDKKVLLIDGNYSAPNLGLHMGIVTPDKTIHHVLSGKVRLKSAVHECYGVDVIPGSYFFPNDINPLKLKDKISGIKQDYDFIRNKLIKKGFETLTGKDGKWMQARTKGAGHGSTSRAFYARTSLVKKIFETAK